jgi:hypothetical protein
MTMSILDTCTPRKDLLARNRRRGSGRSGQETGAPRARPLGDAKLWKTSHVKKSRSANILAYLKRYF